MRCEECTKKLVECTRNTQFAIAKQWQNWEQQDLPKDGLLDVEICEYWSKNDRCDGNKSSYKWTPEQLRDFVEKTPACEPIYDYIGQDQIINGYYITVVYVFGTAVYSGYEC